MYIYAEIDMNSIKRDFAELDNLLVSANDVEFNDMLGEGIAGYSLLIFHKCHKNLMLW